MTNEKKIHLIRHGITEGSKKSWYYGATDLPLLPEARAHLAALRGKGIYPSPDGLRVITSGLLRTEETLSLLFGDIAHERAAALQEYNFGDFECHSYEELMHFESYRRWLDSYCDDSRCPNGESPRMFRERVLGFFETLLPGSAPDILTVCHGGVISAIMQHCFPREGQSMYVWEPAPARGYTLFVADGAAVRYCGI